MLALEIFGPLLIAGINTQPPLSPPPPLLRLFLAISSFDKDWDLLWDRAGFHQAEAPRSAPGYQRGEGAKGGSPAVTNNYEHLMILISMHNFQRNKETRGWGRGLFVPPKCLAWSRRRARPVSRKLIGVNMLLYRRP